MTETQQALTVWAGQAFTPVAWTVGRFEFGEIFGIEFAKFWSGVKFAYLEPTWPFFRRSCGEIWIFSTGETLRSRPNGTVGCIFHVEYFYRGRVTESQPGKHGRKSRWFSPSALHHTARKPVQPRNHDALVYTATESATSSVHKASTLSFAMCKTSKDKSERVCTTTSSNQKQDTKHIIAHTPSPPHSIVRTHSTRNFECV